MGWELRWGGEGEEKVKGRASMDEEREGADSVHEAMDTAHTHHTPSLHFPNH